MKTLALTLHVLHSSMSEVPWHIVCECENPDHRPIEAAYRPFNTIIETLLSSKMNINWAALWRNFTRPV